MIMEYRTSRGALKDMYNIVRHAIKHHTSFSANKKDQLAIFQYNVNVNEVEYLYNNMLTPFESSYNHTSFGNYLPFIKEDINGNGVSESKSLKNRIINIMSLTKIP